VIFTSNGLHLVLSISATIGSKRNCAWVVALLLELVEDRNHRNTALRTFPILSYGLHFLQEESTFVRSLYEESSQQCRTQRIVRCFLGVFRAIDSFMWLCTPHHSKGAQSKYSNSEDWYQKT